MLTWAYLLRILHSEKFAVFQSPKMNEHRVETNIFLFFTEGKLRSLRSIYHILQIILDQRAHKESMCYF